MRDGYKELAEVHMQRHLWITQHAYLMAIIKDSHFKPIDNKTDIQDYEQF